MKILVAGHSGQVAKSLAIRASARSVHLYALGRPELDLCNEASVMRTLDNIEPDLLINAAAYTAVDQAETEPDLAEAVNTVGAGTLARAAAEKSTPIVHISTDYVFDGTKDTAYVETDPVAPLGQYGQSKLAGEREVEKANPKHLIFRTAWVYSPFGKNFVKTMLKLAEARDEVGVVSDQMGNPTSALDIADALLDVAKDVQSHETSNHFRTYHLAGTGDAVWADLAEHVFDVSKTLGGPTADVRRITSEEFPTPVQRPLNSRLNCQKLADTFQIRLPHWRDSARTCVEELLQNRDSTR